MKHVKTINPSDWMLAPESMRIMALLNQNSVTPQALFVGGCVRNILLQRPTADLDIATIHKPDMVSDLCKAAGLAVIPTGIKHGTVTVLDGDYQFEVTTLRRDVSTDGRWADVAFSDSFEEDALRRDFTMNALFADCTGQIFDPTGQGLADLLTGHVRFVGEPSLRIQEDYLRILRFFRFYGSYGRGEPDAAAIKACMDYSEKIPILSRERISQEIFKIVQEDNSTNTFQLMIDCNVLADAFNSYWDVYKRLIVRQKTYKSFSRLARCFVLFYPNFSEKYFIWSGQDKRIFSVFDELRGAIKSKRLSECLYRYDPEIVLQTVFIEEPDENIPKTFNLIRRWIKPTFPLSGYDLMELGMQPGEALGEILSSVEAWWIDMDFIPSKQDCLRKASDLLCKVVP